MKMISSDWFSFKFGNFLYFSILLFCILNIYSIYLIGEYHTIEKITFVLLFFSLFILSFGFGCRLLKKSVRSILSHYYLVTICFSLYIALHHFTYNLFSPSDLFLSFSCLLICISTSLIKSNQTLDVLFSFIFIILFSYLFIYYRLVEPRYFFLDEEQRPPFNNSIYYILCVIPFFLYYKWKYILVVLAFFCVLISGKVGAVLGLIIGLLSYLFITQNKQRKQLFKSIIILLALSIVIVVLYTKVSTELGFDILEKIADDEGTGSGRTDIYMRVIKGISESSFPALIFGHGPFAVSLVYSNAAHNDFLEVLYDYGILGEFFYLYLIILLIRFLFKLIKENSCNAAPFAFSITLFLIMSLVSNVIFVGQYGLILFAYWGMVFSKEKYRLFSKKCLIR